MIQKRLIKTVILTILFLAMVRCYAIVLSPQQQANEIITETGVQGGLIVHVGCGDGTITAALHINDRYLVHGLDPDAKNVIKARKYLQSIGLYGTVMIDRLPAASLPYVDNSVNLLVAEDLGTISEVEVMRILTPNGVAYIKKNKKWTKTIKPRPDEIDEWTHFLYDASNNAVSHDMTVDMPNHIQWIAEPQSARSHDHLASMSVAVSSNGRLFYIADEGPLEALTFPAKWCLHARDAFNGVLLWKRPIGPWEGHLRGFRTGPPEIHRRLIAIKDRVYLTLGYGEPISVLDGATGKLIKTFRKTDDALEIIHHNGVLYVVCGDVDIAEVKKRRSASPPPINKRLLAVRADTGKVLWERDSKDTQELMPLTLAFSDGRLFYQNTDEIMCLGASDGQEQWRTSRPIQKVRRSWSTPTLVVYKGVVLSADQAEPDLTKNAQPEKVEWNFSSQGGYAPYGELIAFSAKTGKEMWRCKARENYNSPPDVLVVNDLVWTGDTVRARDPGITLGRDVFTGEVKKERPRDSEFFTFGFGHHRCYRNKATDEYLLLGRSGVEFLDVDTGTVIANHWIRGTCQYGIMPGNGLLYVPPDSCACFIEAKLNGFISLSGMKKAVAKQSKKFVPRLEKGPAYKKRITMKSIAATDWPTYRRNSGRTGKTPSVMPKEVKHAWQQSIGGRLTSPVMADGKVFVAVKDMHTVYAMNASNGSMVWSYITGGRVDSPPTIYQGLVLFGSADGYVYCVRSSDGVLVWRFRAAPMDRRMVAFGQIESVWPVPGNVMVLEEKLNNSTKVVAYAVAGRSSYIDGGIYLCRLDAVTGKLLSQTIVDHRDPKTGLPPQDTARGVNMPGALPDVLSCDGDFVYMRHTRFDKEGVKLEPTVPHLFSPAGFVDDSWWHRTYWLYGTDMNSGWGGWLTAGNQNPSGRLLVLDENSVYGFGRLEQYDTHGSHVGLEDSLLPWPPPNPKARARGTTHYRLFACSKQVDTVKLKEEAQQKRRGRVQTKIKGYWSKPLEMVVRAMVLADDTLFIAGPPELLTSTSDSRNLKAAQAAYEGKKGAALWAVSTKDGRKLSEYKLDSPPVLDGMIAADGKWFISCMDGKVICLEENL
jgi:outer membrane protein assembly factor BamB